MSSETRGDGTRHLAESAESAASLVPGVVELLPIAGIHLGTPLVSVQETAAGHLLTVRVKVDATLPQADVAADVAARIRDAVADALPSGSPVRVRVRVHAISGRR